MMNNVLKYDIAIIGSGIGGLFTAYKIKELNKNASIIVIDRGESLHKRKCPATNGRACMHCKVCSITSGVAGSGAFSDAKFNLGTAYGGTLGDEVENAQEIINNVDEILQIFADKDTYPEIYKSNEELKLKCLQNNLQLLDMNVRHLGTDKNFITMQRLIEHLNYYNVKFLVNTDVIDLYKIDDNHPYMLSVDDRKIKEIYKLQADKVVIATGRSGADFVEKVCKEFDIDTECNSVDIGVRVEMKDSIWREFSSKIYEPKIIYKTKTFEDKTRMFCFNQGGIVSAENNRGIITANGHSFADKALKTENCNFAVLSSMRFTEPFNKPTEYVENISSLANMIGNGNVIIQRFGDLIRGRRTTEHRLSQNTVKPTLKATAGDISLVLPHRILTNIIETIYALDKVAPGTANDDTLLYGCESKYYSLKPKHNDKFEIKENLYLIGDGSGITRGLSQAAAMGLIVGKTIAESLNK